MTSPALSFLSGSGVGVGNGNQGLEKTRQAWHENEDGSRTFDSPVETGNFMDSHQGKVDGFRGTCGIVSCVNIFRMMGIHMTEELLVNYAKEAMNEDHTRFLCEVGNLDADFNGGTSCYDRQQIMRAFGMESNCEKCTSAEPIAKRVEEGRGVIISVHAGCLYGKYRGIGDNHAVTVTATKRAADGSLLGFYLCDSNDQPSAYYPAAVIENALTGKPMNVTNLILR